MIHVRLFHHVEELPRIGRKAFDVTALPFGIDRIESERGLARPRKAGDHHELVAGNIDVDPLEIVLARAAHLDVLELRHVPPVNRSSTDRRSHLFRQRENENEMGTWAKRDQELAKMPGNGAALSEKSRNKAAGRPDHRYSSDVPSWNRCTRPGSAVILTLLPRKPWWMPCSLPITGSPSCASK